MIPYFSLASEISSDYTQRAKAASFRLTFSLISSIVCVAVPKLIIDMLRSPTGDASTGYIVMALVFGTIFALPMLFTVFGVKEEIITKPTETKLNLKDFVKPLASKSVRKYIAMQVSVGAASGALTSLFFFYVDFCLKGNLTAIGQGNLLGLIAAALMFGMQVIALPVYLKIIAKRDKATIYRWGAFLWIAAMWSLLLIGFNISGGMDIVVILIAAIAGLGICGPMMVPHVTIGDINDAYELEFNVRVEGAVSGICNFTNKTASAIAVASVMALVELFGFVGPKAGESSLGLIQPLSAQTAMMWIIILAPMAFLATGIIVSYTYRINAAKQTQIRRLIDLQRQGIDVSQEKQSLLQTL